MSAWCEVASINEVASPSERGLGVSDHVVAAARFRLENNIMITFQLTIDIT